MAKSILFARTTKTKMVLSKKIIVIVCWIQLNILYHASSMFAPLTWEIPPPLPILYHHASSMFASLTWEIPPPLTIENIFYFQMKTLVSHLLKFTDIQFLQLNLSYGLQKGNLSGWMIAPALGLGIATDFTDFPLRKVQNRLFADSIRFNIIRLWVFQLPNFSSI